VHRTFGIGRGNRYSNYVGDKYPHWCPSRAELTLDKGDINSAWYIPADEVNGVQPGGMRQAWLKAEPCPSNFAAFTIASSPTARPMLVLCPPFFRLDSHRASPRHLDRAPHPNERFWQWAPATLFHELFHSAHEDKCMSDQETTLHPG